MAVAFGHLIVPLEIKSRASGANLEECRWGDNGIGVLHANIGVNMMWQLCAERAGPELLAVLNHFVRPRAAFCLSIPNQKIVLFLRGGLIKLAESI